jgi:hypothetical protein
LPRRPARIAALCESPLGQTVVGRKGLTKRDAHLAIKAGEIKPRYVRGSGILTETGDSVHQYPDLADLVDEERLSLDGAEHEANNRDAMLKNQRDSAVNLVDQWFSAAVTFGANDALLNDEVIIEQLRIKAWR